MDSGNEQRGILMFDDLIFPFPFLLFAQYIYIYYWNIWNNIESRWNFSLLSFLSSSLWTIYYGNINKEQHRIKMFEIQF